MRLPVALDYSGHISNLYQRLNQLTKDMKMYLVGAAVIGFSFIGGSYNILFNIYLLRMGYGVDVIGGINAFGHLSFAFISLPAGKIGARYGSRNPLVLGTVFMASGIGALPLAEYMGHYDWSVTWLFFARLISYCGLALYMVNSNPFIMSASDDRSRALSFSLRSAIWPIFGFVGSIFGGLLPEFYAYMYNVDLQSSLPYRYSIYTTSAILIIAVYFFSQINERGSDLSTDEKQNTDLTNADNSTYSKPHRDLFRIGLISLLAAPGVAAGMVFMNVYLDMVLNIKPTKIGGIIGSAQLLSVPAVLVTPYLLQKFHQGQVYVYTTMGIVVGLLVLSFAENWILISMAYVLLIASRAIRMPAFSLFHQEIVESRWRNEMSGISTMAAAIGFSLTALSGGYITGELRFTFLFLLTAIISLLSIIVFFLWYRQSVTEPQKNYK